MSIESFLVLFDISLTIICFELADLHYPYSFLKYETLNFKHIDLSFNAKNIITPFVGNFARYCGT